MITRYELIEASVADIPVLVQHHRRMFEEIWNVRSLGLDKHKLNEMDVAYKHKLNEDIPNGNCKAWIVKEGEHSIASGAISIASMVPLPTDSTYQVAYLHSVFTEEKYRKQGLAKLVTNKVLDYCKSKHINRVLLNASEAGRPVYEKIGFKFSDNTMSINLKTQT